MRLKVERPRARGSLLRLIWSHCVTRYSCSIRRRSSSELRALVEPSDAKTTSTQGSSESTTLDRGPCTGNIMSCPSHTFVVFHGFAARFSIPHSILTQPVHSNSHSLFNSERHKSLPWRRSLSLSAAVDSRRALYSTGPLPRNSKFGEDSKYIGAPTINSVSEIFFVNLEQCGEGGVSHVSVSYFSACRHRWYSPTVPNQPVSRAYAVVRNHVPCSYACPHRILPSCTGADEYQPVRNRELERPPPRTEQNIRFGIQASTSFVLE